MPPIATRQHVFGAREIIENLRAVGVNLSKSGIRRGLYASAAIIRDEARLRAPVRTGALRKSIVAQTRAAGKFKNGKPTEHVAVVTIAKKAYARGKRGKARGVKRKQGQIMPYLRGQIYPRNYAHLVEFGTRPHAIGKGSDLEITRGSKRKGTRKTVAGPQKGRMHPGARPKPYFRPAFDTKLPAAEAAFKRVVMAEVEKATVRKLAKLGRKTA
jgi:HK97 gp10 family phage protein